MFCKLCQNFMDITNNVSNTNPEEEEEIDNEIESSDYDVSNSSKNVNELYEKYNKKICKALVSISKLESMNGLESMNCEQNYFSNIDKYIIEQMKLIDTYKDDIINNQKMLFMDSNNSISDVIPIITINDVNAYDDIIKNGYDYLTSLKDKLYKEIDKINGENMIKCEIISEIENKINRIWKMWTTNVIDIFANLNYGYY